MKFLTLTQLEKLKACNEAIGCFTENLGKRATLKAVLSKIREKGYSDWEAWLLSHNVALTAALIKIGADVHASDGLALHWAAQNGQTAVVRLLLKHGADVHARNDQALCWAAENGHAAVVKLLLRRGANVHANNNEALCWATQNGQTAVVRLLRRAMQKNNAK